MGSTRVADPIGISITPISGPCETKGSPMCGPESNSSPVGRLDGRYLQNMHELVDERFIKELGPEGRS